MISDFMLQLDRFKKLAKEIMEEKYDLEEWLLSDIIMSLFERKELEYRILTEAEYSLLEEENRLIKFTDNVMEQDNVMRRIYNSLKVKLIDGSDELQFTSDTPGLMKFVMDKARNERQDVTDVFYRRRFELNSIIINMCITLESFISKIIKEVYLNKLPSNFHGKHLTYEELLKIGDLSLAKEFIIEKHLDDLFRKNFNDWYDEVRKNLNIKKSDRITQVIVELSELYQRRNLIVHTDGVVSNQYLQNVENSSFSLGDRVDVDSQYLDRQIKNLEFLGWFVYDGFLNRSLKDIDEAFRELNNKILTRINHSCAAIPELLTVYCSKNFSDPSFNLIAKVNYFLYYKFNGGLESFDQELSDFKVGHLKEEFILAKKILSSDDDVIDSIEKFINSLAPDDFFMYSSWPLFKAVDDKTAVVNIMNNRINEILELNSSPKIEQS